MGHTFANHLYHVIFSTKGRSPLLRREIRGGPYKYTCGVARAKRAALVWAGGAADHVHLLAKIRPVAAVSQVVGAIKANSSRWLSEQGAAMRGFE
ncbi:MAG: transposase [Verrucomicrobia bacterium]|nr:transposase [Verrucomicrobiota bacterium]